MKIIRLTIKEIRKKKLLTVLMLLVCIVAMQTILSAITNAASTTYQEKVFEGNIGIPMDDVLHLHYLGAENNPDFPNNILGSIRYIKGLDGVESVGQFDITGIHFAQLEKMPEYLELNGNLLKGQKYENFPDISQILFTDEEILPLVKSKIASFPTVESGKLPLFVSETFKDIVSDGQTLTDARTGCKYEVVGYIPKGAQWVDENDLIRFPMISLDGFFIAPLAESRKRDGISQLSSLQNTYVFLSHDTGIENAKAQIAEYANQHDFTISSISLAEEYDIYRSETKEFTARQLMLALFISVMAVTSIVAIFTTNTLLKKRQYGIWIANGFTIQDIAAEIIIEIFSLLSISAILSWIWKFVEFVRGHDLFRQVLITAHIRYALPLSLILIVILTVLSALIPVSKLLKYQPCELIGGEDDGTH